VSTLRVCKCVLVCAVSVRSMHMYVQAGSVSTFRVHMCSHVLSIHMCAGVWCQCAPHAPTCRCVPGACPGYTCVQPGCVLSVCTRMQMSGAGLLRAHTRVQACAASMLSVHTCAPLCAASVCVLGLHTRAQVCCPGAHACSGTRVCVLMACHAVSLCPAAAPAPAPSRDAGRRRPAQPLHVPVPAQHLPGAAGHRHRHQLPPQRCERVFGSQ